MSVFTKSARCRRLAVPVTGVAWITLALCFALAACSSASKPQSSSTSAVPSSQPGRSPAASLDSTVTATPARPDVAAATPAECPVSGDACAFAARLNNALTNGDVAAIVGLAASQSYICSGTGTPTGLGGASPLCDGASAGTTRSGYPVAGYGSEGSVLSAEAYGAYIQSFVAQADSSAHDSAGSGALRLVGVGCSAASSAAGKPCADGKPFVVVFSEIAKRSGAPRLVLAFTVADQGQSGPGIVRTVSGPIALSPFNLAGGSTPTPAADMEFFRFSLPPG